MVALDFECHARGRDKVTAARGVRKFVFLWKGKEFWVLHGGDGLLEEKALSRMLALR